jgi:hypothetical protein
MPTSRVMQKDGTYKFHLLTSFLATGTDLLQTTLVFTELRITYLLFLIFFYRKSPSYLFMAIFISFAICVIVYLKFHLAFQ